VEDGELSAGYMAETALAKNLIMAVASPVL
jgi:hypothetical protein